MLAPKKRRQAFLVLLVLIVTTLSIGATVKLWSQKTPQAEASCDLQLDQNCISLDVANNEATRAQGLSGRRNLPTDRAMLFVFDRPGNHCMWMKDMNFPIDIVWLDANKRIVTVAADVAPKTYPKTFCPTEFAQYVLEFPAGMAAKSNLAAGQLLEFQTK